MSLHHEIGKFVASVKAQGARGLAAFPQRLHLAAKLDDLLYAELALWASEDGFRLTNPWRLVYDYIAPLLENDQLWQALQEAVAALPYSATTQKWMEETTTGRKQTAAELKGLVCGLRSAVHILRDISDAVGDTQWSNIALLRAEASAPVMEKANSALLFIKAACEAMPEGHALPLAMDKTVMAERANTCASQLEKFRRLVLRPAQDDVDQAVDTIGGIYARANVQKEAVTR